MAVAEKTLLEFLLDLLNDKDAIAEFRDDPHAALQSAGLGDVSVADIKELLPVVLEKVDAEKCARYEDDCDDDKCWEEKPRHDDDRESHAKPIECDDEGRPAPHSSEIDKVVTHLNYVTNNYSYDSHDSFVTNNNLTKIWAGDGADIDVTNNNVTSGAGGVAVGGDNNAPVVTGDHSFVGDDNQVSGDGSTTSFGSGSATSLDHVGTGDGGAIAVNGDATPTNAFGEGNLVAGPGGVVTDASSDTTDNSQGSHNTDDHSLTNSQNHTTDNSETDNSVNTDASTTDSNNTDLDTSHSGNIEVSDNHLDLGLPIL